MRLLSGGPQLDGRRKAPGGYTPAPWPLGILMPVRPSPRPPAATEPAVPSTAYSVLSTLPSLHRDRSQSGKQAGPAERVGANPDGGPVMDTFRELLELSQREKKGL